MGQLSVLGYSLAMSPYRFMRDELHRVKLAASVEQLRAAYRRLSPLRAHVNMPTSPSKKLIAQQEAFHRPSAKTLARSSGSFTAPGSAFKKKELLGEVENAPVNDYIKQLIAKKVDSTVRQAGATTGGRASLQIAPKGGGTKTLQLLAPELDRNLVAKDAVGTMKGLSPDSQKALNLVIGLHEGHEAAAVKNILKSKHPKILMASHLHPEVILKEHNMLRNLSGEGAEGARKALQQLRGGAAGEGRAIKNMLEQQYGPRAVEGFSYGAKDSPRITKAMRKDLRRRLV